MSVSMGSPSQQSGDIKLLASGSGSLAQGAAGSVSVSSFTRPILAQGQVLILFAQISRSAGAETGGMGFSATSGDSFGTGPCSESGSSYIYGMAHCYKDLSDPIDTTYHTMLNPGGVIESRNGNTKLGDLTAATTIHFNVLRCAASTYSWEYKVFIMGSGVK